MNDQMGFFHRHRGAISLDTLGAGASLACAIHCAALPLMFGLLPGLQLALSAVASEWSGLAQILLWSHEAERFVVSTVVVFAALVLGFGFTRHHSRTPLGVAGAASVLMIIGAFGDWSVSDTTHVWFQVSGGLGIALAHLLNMRALHRHQRQTDARHVDLPQAIG